MNLPSAPAPVGEGVRPAEPAGVMRGLQVGQLYLGKYQIELRVGSVGQTYVATQLPFRRKVTLKLVRVPTQDPALRRKLLRDAAAATKVLHPNVVTAHEVGETPEGELYLATEHLDGETLASELERLGTMPGPRACRLAIQICRGVRAAHDLGVLHGDLGPSSIVLLRDADEGGDLAKVGDFGLARAGAGAGAEAATPPDAALPASRPWAGAPEQLRGQEIDARTDVYALGVLIDHMCGGRTGEPAGARATRDARAMPLELVTIVRRCTETSPAARYPSVQELLADLKAALRLISAEHLVADGKAIERLGLELGSGAVPMDSIDLSSPPMEAFQTRGFERAPVSRGLPPSSRPMITPIGTRPISDDLDRSLLSDAGSSGRARAGSPSTPSASADLVFADPDQQKRRWVLAGVAAGVVLAACLATLALTLAPHSAILRDAIAFAWEGGSRKVALTVTSDPAGAIVLSGEGKVLGATPLAIEVARLPTGARAAYQLHLEGFEVATIATPLDRERIALQVNLRPDPKAKKP